MTEVVRIVVSGRVQGVSYRAFVEREALILGVAGWVRNRRDGTVEAVFAGNETAVAELIVACRRGPRFAQVDMLDQSAGDDVDLKLRRPGEVFSVLPTL